MRGYRGAEAAALGVANRAYQRRHLRWSWADDGSLLFEGRLPADEGALLLAALEGAEVHQTASRSDRDSAEAHGESPSAEAHGESPSAETYREGRAAARRADALVGVARAALAAGADERPGGDPCELVVHLDAETLAADQLQDRSELEHGPALAPETVRRLGCDAAVVRIIERDGQPLSIGRRTRTIPPALRRALRSRDHGCRFPGCTHRRLLHAHHIHHWARGGPTTLGNLIQLCSYHHRLVHEIGFQIERAGPQQVRFRRPDGRPIPHVPRCAAVDEIPLEQANRSCGLTIDEKTCMPRSAGDRLDYGIAVECLLHRRVADQD